MAIVPVATVLSKTKKLWADYSYGRFVDRYEKHFIIAGFAGGAMYPIVTSKQRDAFQDCVYATTFGTIAGSMLGFGAVYTHPIWMAGLLLGGPMWAYQRLRFPA